MFSNLSKDYAFEPFKLGVVRDANYEAAPDLDTVLSSVSAGGSDTQYLDLFDCSSTADGDAQTNAGTIDGYVTVDDSGTPELHLSHADYDSKTASTSATVVQSILDAYVHTVYEYRTVYERDPSLLADPNAMQAFETDAVSTVRLAVTRTSPDPSVRYYYALLGMTYGVEAALPANAYARDGYAFAGWSTSPDGSGTLYADGQSVRDLAESGTVTLYAQWRADAVVLGGGSTTTTTVTTTTTATPRTGDPAGMRSWYVRTLLRSSMTSIVLLSDHVGFAERKQNV